MPTFPNSSARPPTHTVTPHSPSLLQTDRGPSVRWSDGCLLMWEATGRPWTRVGQTVSSSCPSWHLAAPFIIPVPGRQVKAHKKQLAFTSEWNRGVWCWWSIFRPRSQEARRRDRTKTYPWSSYAIWLWSLTVCLGLDPELLMRSENDTHIHNLSQTIGIKQGKGFSVGYCNLIRQREHLKGEGPL